jgi:hypothetical protein
LLQKLPAIFEIIPKCDQVSFETSFMGAARLTQNLQLFGRGFWLIGSPIDQPGKDRRCRAVAQPIISTLSSLAMTYAPDKKLANTKNSGTALSRMDPRLTFVSAMPLPLGASTTIQGFSMERIALHWAWSLMLRLPSTVYEPAGSIQKTLGLRPCGMAGWRHLPIRIDRLLRTRISERSPLWVVFSADPGVAELVSKWSRSQRLRPLHVSVADVSGAIRPSTLTTERLRDHWLQLVSENEQELSGLGDLLGKWLPREVVSASFPFLGHQTVAPNQACLQANGMTGTGFIEHWRGETEQEFDDAIARTFDAIEALRGEAPMPLGVPLMPPRPSLWLVAPAWLPNLRRRLLENVVGTVDRTAISALANRVERQRGFVVHDDPKVQKTLEDSPAAMRLHETRRAELSLFFDAVGWAVAGVAAGVWRIRPAINMVHGRVRQFAENVRAEANTPHAKVSKLFDAMQSEILKAVGNQAVEAVRTANWGVKIISDVPVEWLPVGRVPLGLHCNVSRITATPADLLLRQLETHEMLRLGISDFDEILLVSTFEEGRSDDVMARLIADVFDIKRVKLRLSRVRTKAEFVKAVNDYDGPLMIFDGHGDHPRDQEAHLKVGIEEVRISALEGRIRLPPIVVLSACDTHAVGRSTKSVANAMLQLGARSVLATNLPVRFNEAALMVGDLIRTIDAYLPLMPSDIGRVVRWSEFVGGLIRAHFILAVMFRLVAMGVMSKRDTDDFLPHVVMAARFGTGSQALDQFEAELVDRKLIDRAGFNAVVKHVVAMSDSIRYVQLGNPETILIGTVADLPAEVQGPLSAIGPADPVWKFGEERPAQAIDVMQVLGQVPYGHWRGEREN